MAWTPPTGTVPGTAAMIAWRGGFYFEMRRFIRSHVEHCWHLQPSKHPKPAASLFWLCVASVKDLYVQRPSPCRSNIPLGGGTSQCTQWDGFEECIWNAEGVGWFGLERAEAGGIARAESSNK